MSRSLEARLERLERITPPACLGDVEIIVTGVERNDAGEIVEVDAPPLVFRCPRYDRQEASHDARP